MQRDATVGSISEMACSPRLGKNIGIGLVSNAIADDTGNLKVAVGNTLRKATIAGLPFIR